MLAELQERHQPVLLVGYSMGAAVSIQVAASRTHRLRRQLPGLVRFEAVNTGHS